MDYISESPNYRGFAIQNTFKLLDCILSTVKFKLSPNCTI